MAVTVKNKMQSADGVKTWNTFTIGVTKTSDITEVKNLIAGSVNIPTDTFRIIYNGKELDSEPWRRLAEYMPKLDGEL